LSPSNVPGQRRLHRGEPKGKHRCDGDTPRSSRQQIRKSTSPKCVIANACIAQAVPEPSTGHQGSTYLRCVFKSAGHQLD